MELRKKVKIVQDRHVYWVKFTNRQKGGRYNAAQFDDRFNTYQEVVQWIKSQRNLELVEGD